MLDHKLRVYLAGPMVFMDDAPDQFAAMRRVCTEFGYVALTPIDTDIDLNAKDAAYKIYGGNIAHLHACDAVVADLSPFRGPSADAGTIFEVGFAKALGKRVIGYSTNPTHYLDRVLEYYHCVGNDHCSIEDFLLSDNLMISCSLDRFITHYGDTNIDLFRKALSCL